MECPECDRRLGPDGGCKFCGWQPKSEANSATPPPMYREPTPRPCEHGNTNKRCEKCDATAGVFLKELRQQYQTGEPEPTWPVLVKSGSREPLCALCATKTLPGDWEYRDGRLWHVACWKTVSARGLVRRAERGRS